MLLCRGYGMKYRQRCQRKLQQGSTHTSAQKNVNACSSSSICVWQRNWRSFFAISVGTKLGGIHAITVFFLSSISSWMLSTSICLSFSSLPAKCVYHSYVFLIVVAVSLSFPFSS